MKVCGTDPRSRAYDHKHREKTSAVRPRKLPYKPVIGKLENRTEYGSCPFRFRGLEIRRRLPDRKGNGISRAPESAITPLGFPHPRTARYHPDSIIEHPS